MTANTKSKSTPFAWQDKRVLRLIRDSVEDYGSALVVYLALTVAASDKQSATFSTTHNWLASESGVGVRTVKRRLADLQRVKVLEVITPPLRAPCTYRLLTPDGKALRTLGHGSPTLGHGVSLPRPRSEESNNRTSQGETKPLGTADRIGLTEKAKLLEQEIVELDDRLYYDHDREAHPDLVDKRERLKLDLQKVRDRLKKGIA